MGLDAFNELSQHKAVHALYECCYSVAMAGDLADARPYADHDALYRRADALLFGLPEAAIQLVPTRDREAVGEMLTMHGLIDVIIPRGGKSLTKRVMEDSRVPTLLHLDGMSGDDVDRVFSTFNVTQFADERSAE